MSEIWPAPFSAGLLQSAVRYGRLAYSPVPAVKQSRNLSPERLAAGTAGTGPRCQKTQRRAIPEQQVPGMVDGRTHQQKRTQSVTTFRALLQ